MISIKKNIYILKMINNFNNKLIENYILKMINNFSNKLPNQVSSWAKLKISSRRINLKLILTPIFSNYSSVIEVFKQFEIWYPQKVEKKLIWNLFMFSQIKRKLMAIWHQTELDARINILISVVLGGCSILSIV